MWEIVHKNGKRGRHTLMRDTELFPCPETHISVEGGIDIFMCRLDHSDPQAFIYAVHILYHIISP